MFCFIVEPRKDVLSRQDRHMLNVAYFYFDGFFLGIHTCSIKLLIPQISKVLTEEPHTLVYCLLLSF